jgi:photosystem II stability/assembly factor-like uncharacterized protein
MFHYSSGGIMQKIFGFSLALAVVLALLLCTGAQTLAQAPPYYNFDSTGGANSFPFNVAAGKQVQWLIGAGELNRPTPVPSGYNITKVYFRANTAASPTFSNITVKLGQSTITALPTGVVYTGPLTVVYFRASLNITSAAQGWFSITLDTPFPYDPTQSLIIDVQQCGMTGTGFTINQRTYAPAPRRTYLTSAACPQTYSGQDGALCAFGVEVTPAGIPGWSAQTSGIATALTTVKAVSPQIAWTGGAGGVVLRTTNGGANWSSVGGGAIGTADINAIEAISATTAFATTSPSTSLTHIFRTTNGGTSWDTVYTQNAPALNPFINAIHMFNSTNGIAQGDPVGGRWTVVRTTDGGTTWQRDTVNAPLQVGGEYGANNGMKVIGTTHIWWTPGTGNGLYRSTDGGTTWSRVTLPASGFTAGLNFINTQIGVVGNSGGVASRSTDGGVTWTPVTIGTTGAIYSVGVAGTLDFWATRGTTVQTSNNQGGTFTQQFSDATAGTFNHSSFITSGGNVFGWAVTATGKIYAYFNPVSIHDLGVQSLAKVFSTNRAQLGIDHNVSKQSSQETSAEVAGLPENFSDGVVANPPAITVFPLTTSSFDLTDTVGFRAVVKNFGTFNEPGYQLGWRIDAVNQTPINRGAIAAGASDTVLFQWNEAVTGVHTLRAWTILAGDGNAANDTAVLAFNVGRVPGDTLYNFTLTAELFLGIAKLPSHKLVITSGGTNNTITTDNKWWVTTLRGAIIDTTHYQINNTAGQGFGFRDLAWDGRWLLTSDSPTMRRIDTTTYTELVPAITAPGTLQRGLAAETPNRIWKSNFTTDAVVRFDSNGVQTKTLGIPTVAPYGIAFDKWTSPNRGWLWYAQPSAAGQIRLSKVDTATGALVTTYDYSTAFPTTSSSGGLDIVNDHPEFPGAVVALMVTQLGPGGIISAIYLGQDSTIVGVPEHNGEIPSSFTLSQNYPNPFNPSTTISYGLPTASQVRLSVFNVLGQNVATLHDGIQGPGTYTVNWNGRSSTGQSIASGVYFYRIEARPLDGSGTFTSMKKMLMLK